ncbi:MAG: hypothetical protein FRX49_08381 [Trebouxia sp. A1-2]|nr:MAG: hypothetical protein FRX49_08381 [Trebouxia sp. A1-2]
MQWLSSFRSLQLCNTAAFADAPVKRKPGRPKKSAAGTSETATPGAEASDPSPEQTKKRKKKAKEPVVVPSEPDAVTEEPEAPVLPPPWAQLTPAQVAQQNAEIATLNLQREQADEEKRMLDPKWHARESEGNALIHRDPEWLELEKKVFTQTDDRWVPDYGCFGEGKLHWYSLNVASQRRMKDVALFLTNQVEELPDLESEPGERRHFVTWLPSKLIKNYNWRTEKMGNKTIKWKYGEKLLVQAVMDEELHEMLIGNIFVAGYEFSETVSDRDGIKYTIPKPCSVEYIDSIQTWMDTPEVRTKEQVLLDEFGEAGISGGPMSGASNRMDSDKEYVEVFDDEGGARDKKGRPAQLRRYKHDAYRGSYTNPSNWFSGHTTEADKAPQPGTELGTRLRTVLSQDSRPWTASRTGPSQDSRSGTASRAGPAQDSRPGTASRAGPSQDSRPSSRPGGLQSSGRGRDSQQPDRRSAAGRRNRATDHGNSFAGSKDRMPGFRENLNSPKDSMNRSRDSMHSPRDQRARGIDQNGTAPSESSQSQGWYNPSRFAPRGDAGDVAGSMPDGGNNFDGARSAGTFGANQTDFADPKLSAGEQWEPIGSGRKAWYNPLSSSTSDASGEELPSEALSKPKLSSHRPKGLQAMSSDAKKSLQRKTAAFRDSLRNTQGPAAPSGDQQLPVRDQQLPVRDQQLTSGDQWMEWGSWQKAAPRSAAARQQQDLVEDLLEDKEGRENGRDTLLPGSQSSKPIMQGRAKTIKLRPQSESNPSVQRWGKAPDSAPPGTRGVVRKADSYDPIRKFTQAMRLPDKPPNYIRAADMDKDESTSFEMPSFENMEGAQWSDESLQFNNMAANKSGSHLDEWQREQDSTENKDQTDWRAWGRAIRQEDEDQGTMGTVPRSKVSLEREELAASNRMGRTKNGRATGSEKSPQQSADVYRARSFASDSLSNPSSSSAASSPGQNPFADGGEFDEWGTASPGSGQQQTSAFADPSQSGARQNRSFRKPPQQPASASSSSGRDSWTTDGFDFADMSQDAIDRQARVQPRRTQPRANPKANRATSRQQPAARRHKRSRLGGNSRDFSQASTRHRSDREGDNTLRDPGVSEEVREDFSSIWNDF